VRGDRGRVTLIFYREDPTERFETDRLFESFGAAQRFDILSFTDGRQGLKYADKVSGAMGAGCSHVLTRCPYSAFFSALAGLPVCLELHRPPDDKSASYVATLQRLPAFRGLITITRVLGEEVINQIPGLRDQLHIIPDAADPAAEVKTPFELVRRAGSRVDVGYAGHLYPGKGLEIIVEVARKLPAATFHIVGGMDEDIRYWRERTAGQDNVVFYGFRPHAEIPSFLQAVDVLVAPYLRSVGAHGGKYDVATWMSPLKIFEYMAAGRPIVSSDLPVLREVLQDGRNALMRDPDDIDSWAQAIDRLAADSTLRHALGQAARSNLLQNYTWRVRAERVLQVLAGERASCGSSDSRDPRLRS